MYYIDSEYIVSQYRHHCTEEVYRRACNVMLHQMKKGITVADAEEVFLEAMIKLNNK
jgi:cytosine/adenosine deaminase-related metal-dependent hydrolase